MSNEAKESYDLKIYKINTGTINFTCSVERESIDFLIKMFLQTLKTPKIKNIELFINSRGGSAADAMRFCDFVETMVMPKVSYTTIINGEALSAGHMISIVSHKRLITKRSMIMLHQASGATEGEVSKMRSYVEYCDWYNACDVSNIKQYTNMPEELAKQMIHNETYIPAPKAVEIGLMDGFYDPV